jgi:hypothetical protein
MIAEGIEKLRELCNKAWKPEIIRLPGDDPRRIYHTTPSGALEHIELGPPPRVLVVQTIEDFTSIVTGEHLHANDQMAVFYNESSARLVFHHQDGAEFAWIKFDSTDEFDFFAQQAESPGIEVDALATALKRRIRKCYRDAALVNEVSSLNFMNRDGQSVSVDRGKESMGRSIIQEVEEPANLPDPYQTFHVRRFANHDLDVRFPLVCALDPDTKGRRWTLAPLEDSWIDFKAMTLTHIRDTLRTALKDTGVPIYQGSWGQLPGHK